MGNALLAEYLNSGSLSARPWSRCKQRDADATDWAFDAAGAPAALFVPRLIHHHLP
jgi:hypothetical protein